SACNSVSAALSPELEFPGRYVMAPYSPGETLLTPSTSAHAGAAMDFRWSEFPRPAMQLQEARAKQMEKMRHPVAVCSACHKHSYRVTFINQRCRKRPSGKRCPGVYRNAMASADWKECERCAATAFPDQTRCTACHGVGWFYVGARVP